MRQFLLTDGELQALFSAAMQYANDPQHDLVQCMVWIEACLAALAVRGPLVHHGEVAKIVQTLQAKGVPVPAWRKKKVIPLEERKIL